MDATFYLDATNAELTPDPLDPASILEGTPEVSNLVLDTSPDGKVIRGIWQITPGKVTDIELDELFVVLSGRVTIEIEGREPYDAGPGHIGIVRKDECTIWTVHETLRKAYQITLTEAE